MKLLRFSLVCIIAVFGGISIYAQEKWSLNQCIEYALEHNIQVKQMQLSAESQKVNLTQSKAGTLPNLNISGSDAFSFGRSIDPFTNLFTDHNVQSLSVSISSSVTLFNGLQQYNKIKQNNYNFLASLEEVNEVKNNISLQVATAYLQILFDHELDVVTKNQMEISVSQVKRTKILVEAGSLAKGNLLEVQAQLANEELNFINAQNNLRTAYLNLAQLLELDSVENFRVQVPEISEPSDSIVLDPVNQIFEESTKLPRIKKEEFYVHSSKTGLNISKGGISPRLFLSASYGSGYSSARNKYDTQPSNPQEIGYVGNSGDIVYTPGFNTITLPYNYADQIVDNRSFTFVIGVNIPIFNNLQTKSRISNSKINLDNSQLKLQLAKNQLYKDIQQASNAAYSALAKFKASKKSVDAQTESFSYTQQKFDLGLVNSVDYNTAKNLLTKAQSDLVQAKFDYIFRKNILNFYRGIPFEL